MWYHELSHDERLLYDRTILGSHERRIEAYVLNYNGGLVRDITDLVMPGGEITGDTTREVLQILDLPLADPGRTISFDHPTSVPVSRRRMLQVIDSRRIPGLGWVDEIVHTGPIWTAERDGDTVRVVAHDGSRLAMGSVRQRRNWNRKTRITIVIVALLEAAGATSDQIRIPKLRTTLAKVIHVGHRPKRKHDGKKGGKKKRHRTRKYVADTSDTYWAEAQDLARALGRRLYADPRLVFRFLVKSNRPVFTIDRGDLLAPPNISRPDDGPRPNVFAGQGRDPKGKKHHRPTPKPAVLPAAHEESRESLAWNGKPTENRQTTIFEHAKSKKAVSRELAKQRDEALRVTQQREIVIPTKPQLKAYDVIQVREVGTVAMKQWRYPLSGAEGMTIGSTARVSAMRGRR